VDGEDCRSCDGAEMLHLEHRAKKDEEEEGHHDVEDHVGRMKDEGLQPEDSVCPSGKD
jgi:hypothetical protein